MNLQELIEALDQRYGNAHATDCHLIQEGIKELRQQADRIGVLEASHRTQIEINKKALQYIAELELGLESSINLNKAQAERNQ